ncbi:MAG: SUMF1/EgtB/PvdO family nonheme iron enzyme [Bacteroidota bacterium]
MANRIPHIFIAYARKDKTALDKLRTHLNILQRRKLCRIFFDGEITPGEHWDSRLKEELHRADIFVLLVSEDFLDSDYVNEVELPKILEKQKNNECEVIPVILRDCLWTWTELGELQAVLDDGQPIEETNGYGGAARAIAKKVADHHQAEMGRQGLAYIDQQETDEEGKKQKPAAASRWLFRRNTARKGPEAQQKKQEVEARSLRNNDPFHELMVPVKGGTFQMGDERGDLWRACWPIHKVTVKDFQLCKYPVTQAQWKAVMDGNPSHFSDCTDCPIETVPWDEVQSFLEKLNEQTGGNYRLPTEVEWEFAARGGAQSKNYKYAGSNDLNEVAWYNDNSENKTHPVGRKKANELGLHDMSGNVWEWCQDEWKSYPRSLHPFHDKFRRVVRGGAWFNYSDGCRVSYRRRDSTELMYEYIGFRLARD